MIFQGLLTLIAAAGFAWILWRDRPQWMRRTAAAGLLTLVCVSLAFAVVERFQAAREISNYAAAVRLAGPPPDSNSFAVVNRDFFGWPTSASWSEME